MNLRRAAELAFGDTLGAPAQGYRDAPTVRAVQTALKQRALPPSGNPEFDPGPIDGKWGPKTSAAIAAWQASHYLDPTGEITAELLATLGLSAPASSTSAPPAPAPAPPASVPAATAPPAALPGGTSTPSSSSDTSWVSWVLGGFVLAAVGTAILRRRRQV